MQKQIQQLTANLAITNEIQNELKAIKTQLANTVNTTEGLAVRLDGLTEVAGAVAALQEEMAELRLGIGGESTPPRPSTPKGKSSKFSLL